MLIKMGKAPKDVLKEGITLYQAANKAQTKAPALLGLLSEHSAPVRAWYAFDKGSLVFAKTDIMAFIKIARGFYLAPEEVEGAKKWLDYVAQSAALVPEFHEVYSENLGHVDCTFSYDDAVFWASMPGNNVLEDILKYSVITSGDQLSLLNQVKALHQVAAEFYMSEKLTPFDAQCTSLTDMAERRAGGIYLADPQRDYLANQVTELGGNLPLLTAIITGDTARLREFVAGSISIGHPREFELAKQILEEELPSIPRYQVSRLWDGDYGFSNPLWVYIKAVENMAELVMRFT